MLIALLLACGKNKYVGPAIEFNYYFPISGFLIPSHERTDWDDDTAISLHLTKDTFIIVEFFGRTRTKRNKLIKAIEEKRNTIGNVVESLNLSLDLTVYHTKFWDTLPAHVPQTIYYSLQVWDDGGGYARRNFKVILK